MRVEITYQSLNFSGAIYNTGFVDPRQQMLLFCNTSWKVLLNFNIDLWSMGYWYQFTRPVWRIYASVNMAIIVADNGLSSFRCQATIWTNKTSCQLDTWKTISVKNGEDGGHFLSSWTCLLHIFEVTWQSPHGLKTRFNQSPGCSLPFICTQ